MSTSCKSIEPGEIHSLHPFVRDVVEKARRERAAALRSLTAQAVGALRARFAAPSKGRHGECEAC